MSQANVYEKSRSLTEEGDELLYAGRNMVFAILWSEKVNKEALESFERDQEWRRERGYELLSDNGITGTECKSQAETLGAKLGGYRKGGLFEVIFEVLGFNPRDIGGYRIYLIPKGYYGEGDLDDYITYRPRKEGDLQFLRTVFEDGTTDEDLQGFRFSHEITHFETLRRIEEQLGMRYEDFLPRLQAGVEGFTDLVVNIAKRTLLERSPESIRYFENVTEPRQKRGLFVPESVIYDNWGDFNGMVEELYGICSS
jgi:hypothetical protein